MEKKYCKVCGKELERHNKSGYCVAHLPRTGENNPFFGKTHKKETVELLKQKCAEATKKLWENDEYRKKVIDGATGIKRSDEFKETQRKNALKQFKDKHQHDIRSKRMKQSWKEGSLVYCQHDSINMSKQEVEFVDLIKNAGFDVSHKAFLYKENGRKRHLFPDGIIEDEKIILEYNGSFWHADKNRGYKPDDIIHHNKTANEIWETDAKKIKVYNDNGYQVYTVWSDDFIKNKEKIIKDFCKYVRNKR